MVKFGERLKAARTAKHMSQQALADVIGKSLNTVGLYERGLRQPSLETLCLLADTLPKAIWRFAWPESKTIWGFNSNILSGLHPAFYFVFSKMDPSYV